jgi:hypothetical protein
MVHAPELLILYALDMFLVLSIITVMFDSSFPLAVPYFFQILSIAGTGHMYISQFFDEMFTLESRFWYSFFYLGAMMLSGFAMSAFLLFVKKSYSKGLMFVGSFSLPATSFGVYLMTFYDSYQTTPLILRLFNGYWLVALLIISMMIFLMGTKLFLDSDPRLSQYKINIKQSLKDLIDEEEEIFDEDQQTEDDYYNPVDHVHVGNTAELENEDYEF